ncbi:2-dehydro-3-deoxygalactonokinase [Pacificibacter sp. 1_MG-2023]|nr:2-dehydro-3-deoxygalactonokinase [Pacificibacter sp. 1_MG-2023]
MMTPVTWIAVDWGSSNLRIWAMGSNGAVIERITSDQGMLGLTKDQYEPVLMAHIEPWLGDAPMPVIACGMVGSRQGWIEAPYETVPVRPASQVVTVQTCDPRIDVRVIAGLQQLEPADVMRGEETQIAGYLAQNPRYSGVLCLPGTHSKWVAIDSGKITSFQTVLTGELFDLLAEKSILRHSIGAWNEASFLQAITQSAQAPEALLTGLFGLRASQLLHGDDTGKARLSGMVIGTELGATKAFWQGKDTVIIGAGELARLYGAALSKLGATVNVEKVDTMTLSGLKTVYESVFK